ncbi:MAG: SRPBCC family protein [Bacteroidota bacterium]
MTNTALLSLTSLSALFLLLSFSAKAQKRTITITSKVLVKTTVEEAFELLRQFDRFPEWSPFLVADPDQKYHVTGDNGAIGSAFHWQGVGEKSEGYQTLSVLEENQYLRMDCNISLPFKSTPTFEYRLRRTPEGVEIIQEFSMQPSAFSYLMMRIFKVEAEMQATNQLGLERLKTLLEGVPKAA